MDTRIMDDGNPPVRGRPTDFTQETADLICDGLIAGRSLRSICLDDGMPHASTVCRWLAKHESFREQYARAREAQADAIFDESLDIADDGSNDWMERRNSEGEVIGEMLNSEHVQRSRLRIDTRKWMAGKLRPKVYGDIVRNEHSGPDGGPIKSEMSMDEAARRIAFALVAAGRTTDE